LRQAAWLPYVAPFALFMLTLAIRGALQGPAAEWGIDARWLYALQIVLPGLALLYFLPRLVELRSWPRAGSQWVLALMVGVAVFIAWINLDASWMRVGEPVASFIAADNGNLRWDLILLRCVGAVVLVPVIEEVFWRSFLMRWVDRREFLSQSPQATTLFAAAASSAVFALAHDLWLAGIVAGLAYAWLYVRTGNLWVPIIAHATTNLALAIWVVSGTRWEFW